MVHTVTSTAACGEMVKVMWTAAAGWITCSSTRASILSAASYTARVRLRQCGLSYRRAGCNGGFSGPLTDAELADVEHANWVIWQNAPVTINSPRLQAGAAKLPQQKELTGAIRIVTVANVDVCACCGTHVERCGQVGSIKLTSAQSYRGGTRVTMLCGMRAWRGSLYQVSERRGSLRSAEREDQ